MMNETTNVGSANTTKIICHETDVPTRLSYNLTDGATADVDLVTGEIIVTTPIVAAEDSVMGIPIAHIMRQNMTSEGVTLDSHLSVKEHLKKVENEDKTISYIYTDAKGDRYGFEEVYYTLNGDVRTMVEKNLVEVDADGTMHTSDGEDVFCEYVSLTGLQLSAPKHNLNGIEFLEQRSDKQKQLDEQIESYRNVFKDYVVFNTSTLTIESGSEGVTQGDLFPSEDEELSEEQLILSRSEALQYELLVTQLRSLENEYCVINVVPQGINSSKEIPATFAQWESQIFELETKLKYFLNENTAIDPQNESAIREKFGRAISRGSERVVDEDCYSGISPTSVYKGLGDVDILGSSVISLFRERNLYVQLSYNAYVNQGTSKDSLQQQIDAIVSKKAQTLITLQQYYTTYVGLLAEQKSLKQQMPLYYLSNGTITRGFNEAGQLVMVMDQYEQYAVFEYDEDDTDKLNRIVSNDERSVEFVYVDNSNNLKTITDCNGERYNFIYSENLLTGIVYSDNRRKIIGYSSVGHYVDGCYIETHKIHSLFGRDGKQIEFVYSETSTDVDETIEKLMVKFVWLSVSNIFPPPEEHRDGVEYFPMYEVSIRKLIDYLPGYSVVEIDSDNSSYQERYIFNDEDKLYRYLLIQQNVVIEATQYDSFDTVNEGFCYCYQKSATKVVPKGRIGVEEEIDFSSGNSETTKYDLWHNPTETTKVSHLRLSENKTTHCTETTIYTYNAGGQLIKTETTACWIPEETIVDAESGVTTTIQEPKIEKKAICIYEYNSRGKVVRTRSYVEGEENTLGVTVEETVYDDKGSVVETMTYNSLNPTAKFCARQDVSPEGQVLATYDESGEHKTVVTYQADGVTVREQTLPNGSKFAFGFDDESRSVSITQSTSVGEENSTVKRYTYGMVTELHSGNNMVKYTYDEKRRIQKVELNGVAIVDYTYTVVEANEDTEGGMECAALLPSGAKIITKTELGGTQISKIEQFDNETDVEPSTTITFEYDSRGNMTKRICTSGNEEDQEEFTFDALDVLSSYAQMKPKSKEETDAVAVEPNPEEADMVAVVEEEYDYYYDGLLHQKSECVGNNDGIVYKYQYEKTSARRLSSIEVEDIIICPKTDLLGRYVGKSLVKVETQEADEAATADGTTSEEETLVTTQTTIAEDKITYRKVGDHATNQVSSMSFKDGTFFNYTYDEMGNITSVYENGELVARYTYDDLCRLVREDNKRLDKTVVFVYDNNGNILARREYAFTLVSQATLACTTEVPETFLYVYEGDRLVSLSEQTSSLDKHSCTYDNMGCPITYLGKSMTWDAYGKLTSCLAKDGQTVTYAYDSYGRRVSKTVDNVTTNFIYNKDGNLIYQGVKSVEDNKSNEGNEGVVDNESNAATESNEQNSIFFLYDHAGVMGMKYNNATYFYRKNAQGDVIALLDSNGDVIASYIYDAWGNHKVMVGDIDITNLAEYNNHVGNLNPFRYRSYYFDTETGVYYLLARYYDPAIGRFISQDDHSYLKPNVVNGLNLYIYCRNNPTNYIDTNGRDAVLITDYTFKSGLPIIGHSALLIQDSEGIWHRTELAGDLLDKSTSHVQTESLDDDWRAYYNDRFPNRYIFWNREYVYISGDFTACVPLAESYKKNELDFGEYNAATNNCLDYVQTILRAGTPDNPLTRWYINNTFNPFPSAELRVLFGIRWLMYEAIKAPKRFIDLKFKRFLI